MTIQKGQMEKGKQCIVGALALGALLLGGCGRSVEGEQAGPPERVQPVEVSTVSRQTLAETLTVVASLTANESTDIRAEVSGLVRQIHFTEGQQVEEGDLLVQLDDRELRAQLNEAKVRRELARQTRARTESLFESRSVPESELERALSEFERLQAEVELLEVRFDRLSIRAPFSGRLGRRHVSPGDLVGPADVLSTLSDLSSLKVDFAIPERHSDQIREGATVLVEARSAAGEQIEGYVYFVSPVIDRSTRSVPVKALIENPPAALRPGMFVEVVVVLRLRENVMTVPETAILPRDGRHFLVVVEENGEGRSVIGFRPVTLGLRQLGFIEVSPLGGAGVADGQTIVAAGVGALPLFPGALVEPRPVRTFERGGAGL